MNRGVLLCTIVHTNVTYIDYSQKEINGAQEKRTSLCSSILQVMVVPTAVKWKRTFGRIPRSTSCSETTLFWFPCMWTIKLKPSKRHMTFENEPPRIPSTELLRGTRELVIQHGEDTYRLRLTRNDKLILTK